MSLSMRGFIAALVVGIVVFWFTLPQSASTPHAARPANPELILATTTSTQDSGLLDVLIPMFQNESGYQVKTIAVGSGQAMLLGERGEADVLLVHAPASEQKFVASGFGVNRRLVMHNDFVLLGPSGDPAHLQNTKDAVEALKLIASTQSLFISRGDNSGTHQLENQLWDKAKLKPSGAWYQSTGQGMGATLNVASEKNGYTLGDRATYLALKKNLHLDILLQGDPQLLNIYHVIEVNPSLHPKVNAAGAQAFSNFLLAPRTQNVIADFGKGKFGEALFFPDADKPEY
ncbi:MAG: substrate-binding domain-containing protein [Chloroflexi bacterium]|nr:substrate-binding domain-containing protein [Chloroflexota bacterium]